MVQPVSTGNEALSRTLAFNGGARDIKVARGNHYSDIVRSSLFRKSIFLVSSLFQSRVFSLSLPLPPLSLSPALAFSFSRLYPAVFSNVSLPLERKTKDEERRGSLSEFLVRVAVTLSQIHFAVGEFPLVHVPGIGTRAAFQSREFLRRFLPLLPRAFFPPSVAVRRSPARHSHRKFHDRLENGATERIREALLNGLYLICTRGSSEGIRRDYSRGEWKRSTKSASYRILIYNWETPIRAL